MIESYVKSSQFIEFFIYSAHVFRVFLDLTVFTLTGAPAILLTLLFLASLENFKECLVLISSKQILNNHLKVLV